MATKDKGKPKLTPYQARVLRKYQRILDVTGLGPERALDLSEDDPQAFAPVLKSMTDQAVRSHVIFEYTMIDMELDFVIFRHFFGGGKKLIAARRTKRYKTLRLMLQDLYLMQKLSIVRTLKDVPRAIVSKIAAINDLRNGLAHTFFISDLKEAKRTYRGHSIFTTRGLEVFRDDTREIWYFFQPWLKRILEEEEDENA